MSKHLMERKHGFDSRRYLEAFASLRRAPGAGSVEEGCSEAYDTEGSCRRQFIAYYKLLQKCATHVECLRLWRCPSWVL